MTPQRKPRRMAIIEHVVACWQKGRHKVPKHDLRRQSYDDTLFLVARRLALWYRSDQQSSSFARASAMVFDRAWMASFRPWNRNVEIEIEPRNCAAEGLL